MQKSVSKAEERKHHIDTRKRTQMIRHRIIYIILAIIVLILGIFLSFSLFYNANRIEVRGYSIYETDEIIAASGISKGDNMVSMKFDSIEEKITSALPYIGSVDFKRSFPDKLIITVHEIGISAAFETTDGYVLVNDKAKVLGQVASIEEVLANAELVGGAKLSNDTEETETEVTSFVVESEKIIIVTGAEITKSEFGKEIELKKENAVASYQKIMTFFSENEISGITSINLKDPHNITFMYEDRIIIKIGSVLNLTDKKMAAAAAIIKDQDSVGTNQEGTIDLTVSDKKYYFSPKVETTAPVVTEVVTDENGEAVTNEQGQVVTQVVTTTAESTTAQDGATTKAESTTTTKKAN